MTQRAGAVWRPASRYGALPAQHPYHYRVLSLLSRAPAAWQQAFRCCTCGHLTSAASVGNPMVLIGRVRKAHGVEDAALPVALLWDAKPRQC